DRLTLIFTMIVKGLYFSKFGDRLPEDTIFDIKRVHPSSRNEIWRNGKCVRGVNGPHVWGDVFACMVIRILEVRTITVWYLLFYETLLFLVSTRPPTYDENFIQSHQQDHPIR